MGNGLKELCQELNDRGITSRGKRWYKGGLRIVLRNEAYTGAAVRGRTSKGERALLVVVVRQVAGLCRESGAAVVHSLR